MNKDLISILKTKQFKSIVDCIEYLYLAGYPLIEAYSIAKSISNAKLSFNLKDRTNNDSIILRYFDQCTILHYKSIELNTKFNEPFIRANRLYYFKEGKIWFEQDFIQRQLWVTEPFGYMNEEYVYPVLKKHLNISSFQISYYINESISIGIGATATADLSIAIGSNASYVE